jgi:predicted nucleic acid-binding protein
MLIQRVILFDQQVLLDLFAGGQKRSLEEWMNLPVIPPTIQDVLMMGIIALPA